MKKLTRQSLDELAKTLPVIETDYQMGYVGGGTGTSTDPYTFEEYNALLNAGVWTGGFVGSGYIIGEVAATASIPKEGWFNSYYIGPTSDGVLNAMPKPAHAADYIAQQHDLEYKELGLSGFSGSISPYSVEANDRLIQSCNEVIRLYNIGIYYYEGYPITPEAYTAVIAMKAYFENIGSHSE